MVFANQLFDTFHLLDDGIRLLRTVCSLYARVYIYIYISLFTWQSVRKWEKLPRINDVPLR